MTPNTTRMRRRPVRSASLVAKVQEGRGARASSAVGFSLCDPRRLCLALLCALVAVLIFSRASFGGEGQPAFIPEASRGEAIAPSKNPPFYSDKLNLLCFRDEAGVEYPVLGTADWMKRRGHILAAMEQVMGVLPPLEFNGPPQVEVLEETPTANGVRRKILYTVESPTNRVPAYLFIPRSGGAKRPAMLCLHQTTPEGKAEMAGLRGRTNRQFGLEVAQRGYVTLVPDYPNFGDYRRDAYAAGYASATMQGIVNHRRALDLLASMPEVDARRIGVLGHSLGGHNALFLAVFDERARVVVTSCGFNAFSKYYGGNLAGWSHAGYMPRIRSVYGCDPGRMPFDFTEVLAAIAPRPVFINAPLHDDNFEVSGVKDCVQAAAPVYRLLGAVEALVAVYPDAEHDFPPEVRRQAYAWLDRQLGL